MTLHSRLSHPSPSQTPPITDKPHNKHTPYTWFLGTRLRECPRGSAPGCTPPPFTLHTFNYTSRNTIQGWPPSPSTSSLPTPPLGPIKPTQQDLMNIKSETKEPPTQASKAKQRKEPNIMMSLSNPQSKTSLQISLILKYQYHPH